MEQLGILLDNQVMQNIGVISSLLLPSDALWRMAAQRLNVQKLALLAGGGPFEGFSQPSAFMPGLGAPVHLLSRCSWGCESSRGKGPMSCESARSHYWV